jgi:hypothetical protein
MQFINKSDGGIVVGRFTRKPGEFTVKPPISEDVQAQIDHFMAKGVLEEVTKKATPKPAPMVEPPPSRIETKKTEPAEEEKKPAKKKPAKKKKAAPKKEQLPAKEEVPVKEEAEPEAPFSSFSNSFTNTRDKDKDTDE